MRLAVRVGSALGNLQEMDVEDVIIWSNRYAKTVEKTKP